MPRHPKPTPEQNYGRAVRKAAKVLRDRKWIRGKVGNPLTGMCAIGAIQFAIANNNDFSRTLLVNDAILDFGLWMRESGFSETASIPSWNDHLAKDKEEVILYMEKYADEKDPKLV